MGVPVKEEHSAGQRLTDRRQLLCFHAEVFNRNKMNKVVLKGIQKYKLLDLRSENKELSQP